MTTGLSQQRRRLVLFDFDGTLADSLPWLTRALNDAARRHGFRQIADDEHETLRGLGVGELLRYLGVPRWKIPRIATDLRESMTRDIGAIRCFDGAQRMLRALADQGVSLGIVSSNSIENIRHVLGGECMGLIGDVECGASLFGKHTRLKRLLRRSGVEPAQAIYIGDEVRDIRAAHAIGLAAGAVTWGYNSAEALEACGPELMFEQIADVAPTLCDYFTSRQ